MRYIGKLTNGKVFDKNVSGKPFNFRLGAGEVIKGWDQGIVGMKLGGERKLTIPAPLAYGKRGAPPQIPGNATLVFEVSEHTTRLSKPCTDRLFFTVSLDQVGRYEID
jgi:FK506-binding nuclear protein